MKKAAMEKAAHAPHKKGHGAYFRIPLILLGAVLLLCLLTGYDPPAGRLNWFLEVGPGLAGIIVLIGFARRFPMSHLVYWSCFFHFWILAYGGYYTYAAPPWGTGPKRSLI